jgi:hypothetical protein
VLHDQLRIGTNAPKNSISLAKLGLKKSWSANVTRKKISPHSYAKKVGTASASLSLETFYGFVLSARQWYFSAILLIDLVEHIFDHVGVGYSPTDGLLRKPNPLRSENTKFENDAT